MEVLDLILLNYSDLLSLAIMWNSEIPAQMMTGMWKLPAKQTWVKWLVYSAVGFAGERTALSLSSATLFPSISVHIILLYIYIYMQIWFHIHHPNSWIDVPIEDGEVPPFCQVQLFLWVPSKR